jgi:hypothetical protein
VVKATVKANVNANSGTSASLCTVLDPTWWRLVEENTEEFLISLYPCEGPVPDFIVIPDKRQLPEGLTFPDFTSL